MRVNIRSFLFPAAVILAGALAGGLFGGGSLATGETLDESLKTLGEILTIVEDRYVDDVPSETLVYNAIRGMLRTLDPHSNFLDEESYRDMQEEQHGAFYGLGIVINKPGKDKPLTVISPIEGTPAARMGVRAGDVISHIRDAAAKVDIDTIGIESQEAVKYLRGPKGTEVTITVERVGFDKPLEFTLVRDTVPTNSVTNAFMIRPGTGYIRLINFTQTTAEELDKALESLDAQGMERLVLDLRGNPGGLLAQAVKVSDRFLGGEKLIVYTRGRVRGSAEEYRATNRTDVERFPLVVLVNRGSASASEIVAGALQDHDRALILGQNTFGKGLVQSVFRLSRRTGLALTTAKYYTPSGRLIQRDYSSLEEYFDAEESALPPEDQRESMRTDSGRPVYGGGGIAPDIRVESPEVPRLVVDLARQNAFFNFAVGYVAKHPEVATISGDPARVEAFRAEFVVDDALLESFRAYLRERKIDFDEADLAGAAPRVKGLIKAEIAGALGGLTQRDRVLIDDDPQVRAALDSLEQARLLAQGSSPAPVTQ